MIKNLEEHNNDIIKFDIEGIIETKRNNLYAIDNNDIELPFLKNKDFKYIDLEIFTFINTLLEFRFLIKAKQNSKFVKLEQIYVKRDCEIEDYTFEHIIHRLNKNSDYNEIEKNNIIEELKKLEPIVKDILETIKTVNADIIYELDCFKNEYIDFGTVCDYLEDNKIDITEYIDL